MITYNYAQELRIGEVARDASDKVRGFFYQDFFAIELLINASPDDKVYVEWVEDIYVENDLGISLFQVKHYPKSVPQFVEIFKGMFYQFLKYKLYEDESNKKVVNCYFYCHTAEKNYSEISDEDKKKYVKKENIKSISEYDIIRDKLSECANINSREELLFNDVSSTELLNEFNFEIVKSSNIEQTRSSLKSTLYDEFSKDFVGATLMYPKEDIENILLAIAVQYVQNYYYNKPSEEQYFQRIMTKESFTGYIKNIIGIRDESVTNTIKFFVISYLDNIFHELQQEIKESFISFYQELYFSTKAFLLQNISTSEQRYKFLNTISTYDSSKLNWDTYMQNRKFEIKYYLEHKEKIEHFILRTWKFMFNLNCSEFGEYIKEYSDCFMFNFDGELINPSLLPSSVDNTKREASHLLGRVLEMKEKPRKWYLKGKNVRGKYKYSFDVNKIDDVKLDKEFNVSNLEDETFYIKCMNCLRTDQGEMDIKDGDISNSILHFNCIEENEHGDF